MKNKRICFFSLSLLFNKSIKISYLSTKIFFIIIVFYTEEGKKREINSTNFGKIFLLSYAKIIDIQINNQIQISIYFFSLNI